MSQITLKNLKSGIDLLSLPKEKICKVCGDTKLLKLFMKNGKMKDNRENTCLNCYKKANRLKKSATEEYRKTYFDFQEEPF